MSFILDALRKSESERQREIAPSLAHTPLATIRRETPGWVWLIIALLSVALFASAAAWWRNGSGGVQPVTSTRSEPASPDGIAGDNGARVFQPLDAPDAAPGRAPEIRSITELADIDPALGNLRLELLAHNSSEPSRGSAWINGRRYFPGERIANGPNLVEVRVDGVLLEYRDERFLLNVR